MTKRLFWLVLTAFGCAMQIPISIAGEALMQSKEQEELTVFTGKQLYDAEAFFVQLFLGDIDQSTQSMAESLGFTWRKKDHGVELLDETKTGIGHYFFNFKTASDIVLQAPHQFHDKYTGSITKKLYEEHQFKSLALNSVSRKSQYRKESLDLAHRDDTLFYVYSRAFALAYPKGKLWQFHGFSKSKRKTLRAQQAALILSKGGTLPNHSLRKSGQCLSGAIGLTLTYPDQVGELGGTRNAIGQLLRFLRHDGFLHLEFNLATRKKLKSSPQVRESLVRCLTG